MFQIIGGMKARFVRFAYGMAFVLVLSYALVTLTGSRGVVSLLDKQRAIASQEKRNAELVKDIERRRERIRRLTDDQEEQERLIQERLNFARPGEKVYMLPNSGKTAAPKP